VDGTGQQVERSSPLGLGAVAPQPLLLCWVTEGDRWGTGALLGGDGGGGGDGSAVGSHVA
jgi:hypothetical protein